MFSVLLQVVHDWQLLQVSADNQPGTYKKRVSIGYYKDDPIDYNSINDTLKTKREEVEKFEIRAKRLVEIMRVADLTKIPNRYLLLLLLD